MTRISGIIITLLLSVALISCGSDGSKEAESIIKNQADVTENYVDNLTIAKNADDVVNAIEQYTQGMEQLIPELKEFREKYPEYKQGNVPAEMEADLKRLEEASEKLPGAMMKLSSYMMKPEVQAAMEKMNTEMSKIQ